MAKSAQNPTIKSVKLFGEEENPENRGKMVGARRFEHPTSSSQNWRSTKLSYAPTKPRRERQINKIDFQSKI